MCFTRSKHLSVLYLMAATALVGCLALLAGPARAGEKGDKGKGAKDPLQGTWILTEGVKNGEKAPDEFVNKIKMSFKDDKITIHFGDDTKDATYKIVDAKAKPAHIDLMVEGKTHQGIYEVKDGVL